MRIEEKIDAGNRIHVATEQDRAAVEQGVIDRIDKLFRLANNNPNQAESTAALEKAHKLMEDYNLSEMAISEGASSAKAAKRSDIQFKGGLYQFQRDLWKAIAELNFCFYWNLRVYDADKPVSAYWKRKWGAEDAKKYGRKGGFTFQHRIVGRAVNVNATMHMAQYIEQAIERLVKERIGERVTERVKVRDERRASSNGFYGNFDVKPDTLWGAWAVKYREGISDTVISKIRERRRERLAEERGRSKHNIPDAPAPGAQTGTGLSLMDAVEQEHAANYDFLHGEGAYAKVLERRAKWAAEHAAEQARYTQWCKDNPELAKAEEEKRRKEERRTPWNYGMSSKADKTDSGAYWDGRDAGKKVSIDPQAGADKVKGLLK